MANAMGELRMTGDQEGTRREQESGTLQARRHHTAHQKDREQLVPSKAGRNRNSVRGGFKVPRCRCEMRERKREKERDRERLSAGIPSVNLGPKPNGKWENPLVSYSPTIHQAAPYSAKRRMTSKQLTATRGALSHSHTPLFSFPVLFPPAPIQ